MCDWLQLKTGNRGSQTASSSTVMCTVSASMVSSVCVGGGGGVKGLLLRITELVQVASTCCAVALRQELPVLPPSVFGNLP